MIEMYKQLAEKVFNNTLDYCQKCMQKYNRNIDFYEQLTFDLVSFKVPVNGAPSERTMPYLLAKNFSNKYIDLFSNVKKYLDTHFDKRIKLLYEVDDICQRYFGYDFQYIESITQCIKNHQKYNNNDEKITVFAKYLPILEKLHDIKNAKTKNEAKNIFEEIKPELETLFNFYDEVETYLNLKFTKEVNSHLSNTVSEISKTNNRLKIFNGQPFDLLIHSSMNPHFLLEEQRNKGMSASIIDNKNIRCYSSDSVKFAFYSGIPNNTLVAANTTDNVSFASIYSGTFTNKTFSEYIPFAAFKEKTTNSDFRGGYSELNINACMQPSAVVCFDNIRKKEFDIANKYRLDIILIQTDKYPNIKKPPLEIDLSK